MPTKSDTSAETTVPVDLAEPVRPFAMRFSSTPRGARLARRLVAHRLHEWGVPYNSDPHDAMSLIVGELCANAVTHGHVPGRDFRLRLTMHDMTVRVEVTDSRSASLPDIGSAATREATIAIAESGRGLSLVASAATNWGWHPEVGGRGKTVWAELRLDAPRADPSSTDATVSGT
jgi:anti-sigma regulatory factor (Ser/Thr protein kinase)